MGHQRGLVPGTPLMLGPGRRRRGDERARATLSTQRLRASHADPADAPGRGANRASAAAAPKRAVPTADVHAAHVPADAAARDATELAVHALRSPAARARPGLPAPHGAAAAATAAAAADAIHEPGRPQSAPNGTLAAHAASDDHDAHEPLRHAPAADLLPARGRVSRAARGLRPSAPAAPPALWRPHGLPAAGTRTSATATGSRRSLPAPNEHAGHLRAGAHAHAVPARPEHRTTAAAAVHAAPSAAHAGRPVHVDGPAVVIGPRINQQCVHANLVGDGADDGGLLLPGRAPLFKRGAQNQDAQPAQIQVRGRVQSLRRQVQGCRSLPGTVHLHRRVCTRT
mmetsp:Transcript_8141/g.22395  ORF Transcript_8141/g.22395 Transcript_8141/m.22395 type:complete len:342 (+) Transcript_8141:227-1252(+)